METPKKDYKIKQYQKVRLNQYYQKVIKQSDDNLDKSKK